jgi:hypothetical protein
MTPHLTNLQLLVGVLALVIVAVLSLASLVGIRRKRTPPFFNYFYSDFEQDQVNRDSSARCSFSGLDEWRAYNRGRLHAYEARSTALHNGPWE